jgi:hypothetical protein
VVGAGQQVNDGLGKAANSTINAINSVGNGKQREWLAHTSDGASPICQSWLL